MVWSDRVRFPVLLFEVGIYAKLCVSMIKTLWNIYIKQKTRNLTRIPIFAMIGGVRMCEFCSYKNNPFIIYGKEIKINKCAKETDLTEAQVMRNRDDDVPGIVIYKGCSATGYFDINYCPICGRKLVE